MSFQDLQLKSEYRSLLNDVVSNFYVPVLNESVLYKRAVGFFSSSALLKLSSGILGLVKNGGKIQLIASPRLREDDINAINDGFRKKSTVIEESLLRELEAPVDASDKARLNLLSNLIACGRLEIKIAILEENNAIGMFHEKLGLMYDAKGNIIAFSGSMNETSVAFSVNYEAIDVYTSWTQDEERVLSKQSAFDAMWNDYEPSIKVVSFPNVDKEIIKKYRITDSVETAISLIKEKTSTIGTRQGSHEKKKGPCVPDYVHLRDYQLSAINAWDQANFCGIFDMATGTGKTYTALAAIAHLYEKMEGNLAVIIVCPYQHLVEQWKEDVVAFGMTPIICYSASTQKDWKTRLKTAITSFNIGAKNHFAMVTTNATFRLDYVQEMIRKLRGNVVLVVDEAHNFGAEHLSSVMMANAPFRLALSATIDRYGDEEGTKKLYDYFGNKCIEYTLKDAIDHGMLTPYYYYPVVVSLNDEELEGYLAITDQIGKNIKKDAFGKPYLTEMGKQLLIKRARLVAGAVSKLSKLKELSAAAENKE